MNGFVNSDKVDRRDATQDISQNVGQGVMQKVMQDGRQKKIPALIGYFPGKTEYDLYWIGWGFILLFFLFMGAVQLINAQMRKALGWGIADIAIECVWWKYFGIYCPGCGGTRAVHALFHFQLLKSAYYHPFVPYMAVGGGWYMLSHTIGIVSKGRWKGIRFHNWYVILALVILVLQFILKNVLLLGFGIHTLQ